MEVIHGFFESPQPCRNQVCFEEEPGDLLEKSWFFGNLLDSKTRMTRCHSDPYPSSKLSEDEVSGGKSYEETYSSLNKLPQGAAGLASSSGLKRAPSLPEGSNQHAKGRNHVHRGSKSGLPPPPNSLSRAPSLPTFLGMEEIHDEESEFSMSKLIRQASLKTSDMLPPPRRLPKAAAQSSTSPTPKNRQRRKPDLENTKTESPEGKMERSNPSSRGRLDRSSSDIVELKNFRNLGLKWDNQDLSPKEAKANVRGPSEGEPKKYRVYDQGMKLQRSSSSMDKRSAEDMKAQIKFWARAVASNVRQEC